MIILIRYYILLNIPTLTLSTKITLQKTSNIVGIYSIKLIWYVVHYLEKFLYSLMLLTVFSTGIYI